MKNVLITLIVVGVIVTAGVGLMSRQVTPYVISLLEEQLDKDITLEDFKYSFPSDFQINQFAINERGVFRGEETLSADHIRFSLSPLDLLQKKVVFNSILIKSPRLTLRKYRGEVLHPLNSLEGKARGVDSSGNNPPSPQTNSEVHDKESALMIGVNRLQILDGLMQFIDYDIDRRGFVIAFQNLNTDINNYFPSIPGSIMTYELSTNLLQSRQVPPAVAKFSGWTQASNLETQADLELHNLWIPYFTPYYKKITPSQIIDGVLDIQSKTVIENKVWTSNLQTRIRRLQFGQFEVGNQILGFDAMSIIEILKNNAGNIELNFPFAWDMKNPNLNFKDSLKYGLQHAIKTTFLNNIESVVSNTLEHIAEGGTDFIKKDWKSIIKKDSIGGLVGQILDAVE